MSFGVGRTMTQPLPSLPTLELQTQSGDAGGVDDEGVWGWLARTRGEGRVEAKYTLRGDKPLQGGRGEGCWMAIADQRVSTKHFAIQRCSDSQVVTIVDHSTNGTYVNGHRLTKSRPHRLRPGDEISILPTAEVALVFRERSVAAPPVAALPATPPRTAASQAQAAKRLTWQRGNLIGKGGFGDVYLGMNCETGELIAIKSMVVREGVDAAAVEVEIDLLQKLRHPNVVRYITSRVDDSSAGSPHLNIVMEYVPGGSLLQLIQKFGKFHENVIRGYVEQALCGLQFLHDHLVIHRDIKAANMLVTDAGVVKLSDFGSALSLNKPAPASHGAESGADAETPADTDGSHSPVPSIAKPKQMLITGTPQWIAPEVIKENKVSAKSDIWSFGCVVIEMCTARPPWSEKKFTNAFSTLYHVGQGKEVPAYPAPPAVSKLLHSFMADCLQLDPRDRLSSQLLRKHAFMTQSGSVLRQSLRGGVYRPMPSSLSQQSPAKRRRLNEEDVPQAVQYETLSSYCPTGDTSGSGFTTFNDDESMLSQSVALDPQHARFLRQQQGRAQQDQQGMLGTLTRGQASLAQADPPTGCRPTGLTAAFANLNPHDGGDGNP